jgi:hypothetical protein
MCLFARQISNETGWCCYVPFIHIADTTLTSVAMGSSGSRVLSPRFPDTSQTRLMASSSMAWPPSAQELRKSNVNICSDDWERRVAKRLSAVASVKNSAEYQEMRARRRSMQVSGTSSTLANLPDTPQPTDRTISKREWEKKIQDWRRGIKQWGRVEGLDLVVVISDSEDGVARLHRSEIRGR